MIGYEPRNSGRSACCPAAIRPYARARFPEIERYVPAGNADSAGATSYETAKSSVVSPKFHPAWKAEMLASAMSGFLANFVRRNSTVPSVGRWYIQLSSPRANMFLERPASLRDSPNSFSASTVSVVSGTSCTLYPSREPSSRGLAS